MKRNRISWDSGFFKLMIIRKGRKKLTIIMDNHALFNLPRSKLVNVDLLLVQIVKMIQKDAFILLILEKENIMKIP